MCDCDTIKPNNFKVNSPNYGVNTYPNVKQNAAQERAMQEQVKLELYRQQFEQKKQGK